MSRHPTSTNSPFLARAIVPTGVQLGAPWLWSCPSIYLEFGRSSSAQNFGTIKIKAEIQKRSVDPCVLMQEMEAQRTRSDDEKRNRVLRHHALVSLTSFYNSRQTNQNTYGTLIISVIFRIFLCMRLRFCFLTRNISAGRCLSEFN